MGRLIRYITNIRQEHDANNMFKIPSTRWPWDMYSYKLQYKGKNILHV